MQFILLVSGILIAGILIFLTSIFKKKNIDIVRVVGIVLSLLIAIATTARAFAPYDALQYVRNIFLLDIYTPIDAPSTWLFVEQPAMHLVIVIILWLLNATACFGMLNGFFKNKTTNFVFIIMGFISILLTTIFWKETVIGVNGFAPLNFQLLGFYFHYLFILISLIYTTYIFIKGYKTEYKISKKLIIDTVCIILAAIFMYMPLYFPILVNGDVDVSNAALIPDKMSATQIMYLALNIIFVVAGVLAFKKKEFAVKKYFVVFLAVAQFMQFFSGWKIEEFSDIPLQLCNAGVVIIAIAFVFNIKSFYYFSLLVNVIGSVFAMAYPDYDSYNSVILPSVTLFYSNHIWIFVIPIIALYLGIFPRPTLKSMLAGTAVFTVYFLFVMFLNSYVNNSTLDINGKPYLDYFFTYSNHLTKIVGMERIQYDNVIVFEFLNHKMTIYYIFNILYFLAYIVLMVIMWFIFDFIFKTADNHKIFSEKKAKIKNDLENFMKLLNGRNPSERLLLDGGEMIKIEHFSKKYSNADKYAVKDFNLEINAGEVFGFIGHNGAGKSTTIKSLVGIQNITEGDMYVEGYSIKSQAIEAKRLMAYISDNHAVYERLTGREYINYVADLYKIEEEHRVERLNYLLDKLSLRFAIDSEIKTYSHGMKQKIVVISALIHNPKVWILDEPLMGLDPMSAKEIKSMMREHADKGNIVFFSSHDIDTVKEICDRIGMITNGVLKGVYIMKDLIANNINISDLYFEK